MNLNPRRGNDEPEINLTPLIDVVFLMLIFFMVSTTFLKESDLDIALPEASQQPTRQDSEPIRITINPEGNFFVNGNELVNTKIGTVERALTEALGERSAEAIPVVIRADGDTQHERVVTAMDAAQRAGLRKVGIATVPRDE
jgi:biopolymer transport protein ExbD